MSSIVAGIVALIVGAVLGTASTVAIVNVATQEGSPSEPGQSELIVYGNN